MSSSPAARRTVEVAGGGARLFVRDVGDQRDDVMIVLHGGPDFDHSYLLPETDALADVRRLVYYDQRGRGRSTADERAERVTLESEVDDLDAVRRSSGAEQVTLLGHSWGGLLAMEYQHEGEADPAPPVGAARSNQ